MKQGLDKGKLQGNNLPPNKNQIPSKMPLDKNKTY